MTHILHRQTSHSIHPPRTARDSSSATTRARSGRCIERCRVSCLGIRIPMCSQPCASNSTSSHMLIPAFSRLRSPQLADELGCAPPGMGCLSVSGIRGYGGRAQVARQYFAERGELERRYVVARRQSYHGITWARSQSAADRTPAVAPLLIETHVSPAYEYRAAAPTRRRKLRRALGAGA